MALDLICMMASSGGSYVDDSSVVGEDDVVSVSVEEESKLVVNLILVDERVNDRVDSVSRGGLEIEKDATIVRVQSRANVMVEGAMTDYYMISYNVVEMAREREVV